MKRLLGLIALLVMAGVSHAQGVVEQPANTVMGCGNAPCAPKGMTTLPGGVSPNIFPVLVYGSGCLTEIGNCINAAIVAANAAGGGDVVVPAGTWNATVQIVNNYSDVRLFGAGIGQHGIDGATVIKWTGGILHNSCNSGGPCAVVYVGQPTTGAIFDSGIWESELMPTIKSMWLWRFSKSATRCSGTGRETD